MNKAVFTYSSTCLDCKLNHTGFNELIYICNNCKSRNMANSTNYSVIECKKQFKSKLRYRK